MANHNTPVALFARSLCILFFFRFSCVFQSVCLSSVASVIDCPRPYNALALSAVVLSGILFAKKQSTVLLFLTLTDDASSLFDGATCVVE